eukprot:330178-Pleurochrysis_carterae.AAC.1
MLQVARVAPSQERGPSLLAALLTLMLITPLGIEAAAAPTESARNSPPSPSSFSPPAAAAEGDSSVLLTRDAREKLLREVDAALRSKRGAEWHSPAAERLLEGLLAQLSHAGGGGSGGKMGEEATHEVEREGGDGLVKGREIRDKARASGRRRHGWGGGGGAAGGEAWSAGRTEALWLLCRASLGSVEAALVELEAAAARVRSVRVEWARAFGLSAVSPGARLGSLLTRRLGAGRGVRGKKETKGREGAQKGGRREAEQGSGIGVSMGGGRGRGARTGTGKKDAGRSKRAEAASDGSDTDELERGGGVWEAESVGMGPRSTRLGMGARNRALLRSERMLAAHAGILHDLRVGLLSAGGEWLEFGRWLGGPPLPQMEWDVQLSEGQRAQMVLICARVRLVMSTLAAQMREHGVFTLYRATHPLAEDARVGVGGGRRFRGVDGSGGGGHGGGGDDDSIIGAGIGRRAGDGCEEWRGACAVRVARPWPQRLARREHSGSSLLCSEGLASGRSDAELVAAMAADGCADVSRDDMLQCTFELLQHLRAVRASVRSRTIPADLVAPSTIFVRHCMKVIFLLATLAYAVSAL